MELRNFGMNSPTNPALQMALDALKWASENQIVGIDVLEERAIFKLGTASIPFYVQEAMFLIQTGVAVLPKSE
jgi:hypothetical protein